MTVFSLSQQDWRSLAAIGFTPHNAAIARRRYEDYTLYVTKVEGVWKAVLSHGSSVPSFEIPGSSDLKEAVAAGFTYSYYREEKAAAVLQGFDPEAPASLSGLVSAVRTYASEVAEMMKELRTKGGTLPKHCQRTDVDYYFESSHSMSFRRGALEAARAVAVQRYLAQLCGFPVEEIDAVFQDNYCPSAP